MQHNLKVDSSTELKQINLKLYITTIFFFLFNALLAQNANNIIKDGNDAYKKGDFKNAAQLYLKALSKDSKNDITKFNLGNALEKQINFSEAEKYYNEVASTTMNSDIKSKALYNKGVTEAQQEKLVEAIEAFKKALLLNPDDNDTRENLQKAINDLKKKQQNTPVAQNEKKQQKQQQDKSQTKQPNEQMIEQKFNELRDKEKQLQKMLQKKNNQLQPDKDW
jgi:Ca-activated chloride channel family protein